MSAQTLIFCVGATKAGTSWLHQFLRNHEDCYFRNFKELHYFDSLDFGKTAHYQKYQATRLAGLREKLEQHPHRDTNTWLPTLISDIETWLALFEEQNADDAAYLGYVGYGTKEAKIVGDITPAYGQVSSEMLRRMSSLCEDVKFIFILRDPVERLWSSMRMTASRQGDAAMETCVAEYLNDQNDKLSASSDYKSMLKRMQAVIPRKNLHLEFYEHMFTQDAVDRICEFLEIKPSSAAFDKVVHKGKKMELPSVLRVEFESKLKPQYSFIEDYMGGLPSEWTEKMVNA